MTRPLAAAMKTIAAGTAPEGSAKPRVNIDDPASVNADATPRAAKGHSSRPYPTKMTTSQATSWAISSVAAWVASSRSRRLYSSMCAISPWYDMSTAWSTQRISRPLTERDTISVPTTLPAAVSTSRPPITAATIRPVIGTITFSPLVRGSRCRACGWAPAASSRPGR